MIENILLAACEGDRTSDRLYRQLRGIILQEPIIKPLLPSFVRTSVPAVTSITSGPTSRAGQLAADRARIELTALLASSRNIGYELEVRFITANYEKPSKLAKITA